MNNLVKIILISVIIFMLLGCSCSCKNSNKERFVDNINKFLEKQYSLNKLFSNIITKLDNENNKLKLKFTKLKKEFNLHSHEPGKLPCTECSSKDYPICSHVKDSVDC